MTLKKITTLLASMLFITSTGCNSTSDSQLKQTLLVNAADEQVAEIISRILDADKVRLSGGVFTQQSSLVLSHPNVVDSQGNPIMGKQITMPDRFMLMRDKDQCYIHHLNSDTLVAAPQLQCQ
ncbi:hypothetical protein [Pseudoalteromonas ruthenica]|uniref:hypothetical protein n=1 Tax=Pseudoalteromonas ruthenica TaxID=151081 RepID=UPI0012478DEB|nr:hypothetical protein [Pseudoalteromonas ruthenica]